jgi:hypothetical protein
MLKTKVNNVAEQIWGRFSENLMVQQINHACKLQSFVTLRQIVHAQRGAEFA